MIEVSHVTKKYGNHVALDDVSFTAPDGEITAFLGNNGAGKSTTLRIITGLDTPTSGTATIDGVPYAMIPRPLTKVGSLLDAGVVNPNRSAYDYMKILCLSHGLAGDNIDELLDMVGLGQVKKKPVGEFSLGMHQRLGIAGVLVSDPTHVILDEPTNGLDPDAIHWVRTLVKTLSEQGKTVLMSSHQLSEVAHVADNVVIIDEGVVKHDSTMDELYKTYQKSGSIVHSDNDTLLADNLRTMGGNITADGDNMVVDNLTPEQVGDVARTCGVALRLLQDRTTTLEDIFFQVTGKAGGQ